MKPAILIPYRNRKNHLDVFLKLVPIYLEQVNCVKDYTIYIAEQNSRDIFNLSLSRNIAAMFAMYIDRSCDYLIPHDVDVIPIENIDYDIRPYNVAWFMSAGSCKIHFDAFERANGYDPGFVGWGGEDADFYHRLTSVGCSVVEWHKSRESRQSIICNLEIQNTSKQEMLGLSKQYFGYVDSGPRFISHADAFPDVHIVRYDKSKDFLLPECERKNNKLRDRVYTMPLTEKLKYIQRNGKNLVDLTAVHVKERNKNCVWLTYDSKRALKGLSIL